MLLRKETQPYASCHIAVMKLLKVEPYRKEQEFFLHLLFAAMQETTKAIVFLHYPKDPFHLYGTINAQYCAMFREKGFEIPFLQFVVIHR